MSNLNAELALAAARVRLLTENLPEAHRPDVDAEWRELLDVVDNTRSDGAKLIAIVEWRAAFERRMTSVLLNAPLNP